MLSEQLGKNIACFILSSWIAIWAFHLYL